MSLKTVAICALVAVATSVTISAAVSPGENILSNGKLEADQTDYPICWSVYIRDRKLVKWMPSGGPDSLPHFRLFSTAPEPHDTTIRQGGLRLASNGVYRLSVKVRTKDFRYRNAGVVVANGGWKRSVAVGNIPKDTAGKWKEMACRFEPFDKDGVHTVIFFASGFTGTFDVADPRLTAENDVALAETEPSALSAAATAPRFVPFAPLLWEIPRAKREVTFRFFGKVPSGRLEDYDLELSVDEAAVAGRPPYQTASVATASVATASVATASVATASVGCARRARRTPLSKGPIIVTLPEGVEQGVMTVRGVARATGREMCREQFTFRTVDAPEIPAECGRRLNNLSTELLNEPLGVGCSRYGEFRGLGEKEKTQKNSKAPKLPEAKATASFRFTMPRSGWLYIAVRRAEGCPPYHAESSGRARCPQRAVSVMLDGREVIGAGTPRAETFREVEVGPHEITVKGGEGRLVVRSIAEIISYCPCVKCPVREGPCYDWPYEERYVLPAITTQNGGNIPTNALPSFRTRGYRWIANLNTTGLSSNALERALTGCTGLTAPYYSGVTCDEQFFYKPHEIAAYTKGLKAYDFVHSPERVIYTWIVGKPMTPALDQEFLATCINASRGRGKLLLEMYCRTNGETEEEAHAHLKRYVADTLDRYRERHPLAVASAGAIFGNFNQVPILSLVHNPAIDYKYYLDMQLNLAANDPSCRDLGAVGYWGCNYADDEMKRWSFALMRHYVVEGRTNMLSSAYGFRYRPGHLEDGDFCGGRGATALPDCGGGRGATALPDGGGHAGRVTLPAPWKATGNVHTDSHPEFARRSQCRWGGNGGVGDTFAVLVREDGAPATVSQTAKGLVPGRTYCLQFSTFDVKDVKANRIAPRRFGIDVKLGAGAEIRKDLSWVYVDKRTKGRYDFNDNVARVNLHHIVFTARAAETEIVFDNVGAEAGEELGINYVSLTPYFEGSASDL